VKNLLVIDDDPMAIKLVRDLASASGYNVLTALNGRDGLEVAARQKPDIILLDIMMPEMDGYKVASSLKSNPKTSGIPIIMVTAVGFQLNKQLAINMGVSDYVVKPFNIRELLDKIGKCLTPLSARA
jgi:two-component system alkaline phosphatase synthesis response regulator PhoP